MKTRRAAVALLLSTTMIGAGIGSAVAKLRYERVSVRIPVCQEDERFLKGKGDFDGERWDRYVCVHPDSFSR